MSDGKALPSAWQAKADAAFHAHLDECRQCRDNPMGLCVKGRGLLIATAADIAPLLSPPAEGRKPNDE